MFVGEAGSSNDISTVGVSPYFAALSSGARPNSYPFTVGGEQFSTAYHLADGIYPQTPLFMGPIHAPVTPAEQAFTRHQEAARKDVERLFGVVQGRWRVVRAASHRVGLRRHANVVALIEVCFLLHNMMVHHGLARGDRSAPCRVSRAVSHELWIQWTSSRTTQSRHKMKSKQHTCTAYVWWPRSLQCTTELRTCS